MTPDPATALPGGSDHVGPRIRALREERGMSLSALARAAGVGKATLSGLEAGTRNPTLDTLHSVAAALGVALTALVEGRPARIVGRAVRIDLLRAFDDGPATYELYRMQIPAGASQVSPAHHPGVTEHATVFAGCLRAGPVEAPGRAEAGGFLEWAADVPHGYAAEGTADVHASLLIRYPR
ncbi:XRE family transcriptional regulator [Pseudonocardia ailaonensis]|uniref:XRE family transcriptional regulator n=1 Tax=Pseudonocardia ailaonensis TaxID=367279 RepID=UPI0031D79A68